MPRTPNAFVRGTTTATLVAFTALALVAPGAQAGVIATGQALDQAALDADRAKLAATLSRDDVRAALVARGVDPRLVDARVAALTADEVRQLNQEMDEMPAGGSVLGTVAFIFLLLLLTDLLGWTDVFPFTKKGALDK